MLGFAVALALALLSYGYQRHGPEVGVFGNVCGPNEDQHCLRPVLNGGFPLGYVFDNPGTSVRDKLTPIVEDEVRVIPLLLNVAFYWFCSLTVQWSVKRIRVLRENSA